MVKVQKPQPKTLSKGNKIEGVAKEKQKVSKTIKKAKVSAPAVVDSKKVAPKKAEIKHKSGVVTVTPATPPATPKPKPKEKLSKKPLILAPPESPAAPPAKIAKKAAAVKATATKVKKDVPVEKKPEKQEKQSKKQKPAKKEPVIPAKKQVPAKKETEKPTKKQAPVDKKSEKVETQPKKQAEKQQKQAKKPVPVEKKSDKQEKQQKQQAPPVAKKSDKQEKQPKTQVPAAKKSEKPEKPTTVSVAKNAKKQPQLTKPAKKVAKKEVKVLATKVGKAVKTKGKGKPKGKAAQKPVKMVKKVVKLQYELKGFDEDKFNEIVNESNVEKVCNALKTQVAEEVKKQKTTSIFSDYRYMLQVASYKIPSCPKRVVKLALKHSLIGNDDDVALIVTDLQRGAKFDYEPTVQHYEDLLREAGIKQRLSIVPFNRLRKDMVTFEAKRKFLNSYDYLLCDGRISGQASAFLGQSTQKPRNVLHALHMSKPEQLQKEITRALCRTAYKQLRKGDLTTIPIGNHEHTGPQLTENILTVVKQLQQHYPGGLANIRSMYLKIDIVGTSALPLYISMCAPPADVPYVVGPREQRMLKLKKQANEVLTKFALTKDVGFIKLTRDQVERKAELRQKRLELNAAAAAADGNGPSKADNDEEESPVPAKKARKNPPLKKVKPVEESEDDDDDDDEDDEDED